MQSVTFSRARWRSGGPRVTRKRFCAAFRFALHRHSADLHVRAACTLVCFSGLGSVLCHRNGARRTLTQKPCTPGRTLRLLTTTLAPYTPSPRITLIEQGYFVTFSPPCFLLARLVTFSHPVTSHTHTHNRPLRSPRQRALPKFRLCDHRDDARRHSTEVPARRQPAHDSRSTCAPWRRRSPTTLDICALDTR